MHPLPRLPLLRIVTACVMSLLLPAAGLAQQAETTVVPEERTRFQWKPALLQSALFLGMEHGGRILFQAKTRAELGGPFFKDYWKSLQGIGGWKDGDSIFTNYYAHPFQGMVSGYIQIHNDPLYVRDRFSSNPHYWTSRLRAFTFSFAYSTLFELGIASEASIGNVGLKPGTAGLVDFVVTPIGGLGMVVGEDALDRYIIERIEGRVRNPVLRATARTLLNPGRGFANLLRWRSPWHRDTRGGVSEMD